MPSVRNKVNIQWRERNDLKYREINFGDKDVSLQGSKLSRLCFSKNIRTHKYIYAAEHHHTP